MYVANKTMDIKWGEVTRSEMMDMIIQLVDSTDIVNDVYDNQLSEVEINGKTVTFNWSNREYTKDTIRATIISKGEHGIWVISREFIRYNFYSNMRSGSLRDRMTLFWMDHFASGNDDLRCPKKLFLKYQLYQEYVLGNFRTFVSTVGKDPFMLNFLDGDDNVKEHPNENYARELYELFTLGVDGNYTEQDIRETARALTGWTFEESNDPSTDVVFKSENFDDAQKTIFGITDNFDYDGVIQNLFRKRSYRIAKYICTKLYTYFVTPNPPNWVISNLITTFRDNNFEIEPVLRELLESNHFFGTVRVGTLIKSPVELAIQFQVEANLDYSTDAIDNQDKMNYLTYVSSTYYLGMDVVNPPSVFGWPKDRTWLNTDIANPF